MPGGFQCWFGGIPCRNNALLWLYLFVDLAPVPA